QPAIERGLGEGNEVEGARHQSAYDAHSGPQKEQVHDVPYLLSSWVSAAIYLSLTMRSLVLQVNQNDQEVCAFNATTRLSRGPDCMPHNPRAGLNGLAMTRKAFRKERIENREALCPRCGQIHIW